MQRAELREHIRLMSLVEDGNVTDAQLNELITQAIRRVDKESKSWPFTATSTSLSLTASTRTISLPADFKYGIKLIDEDFDTALPKVGPQYGFQHLMDDDVTNTRPTRFWIWNSNIYLYPVPSTTDANRLTLYYHKTIDVLSDDVTELAWDEAFHYIVVWDVLSKLYWREEYFDAAAQADAQRQIMLQEMHRFYRTNFDEEPQLFGDGVHRKGQFTDPNLPILDGV